MQTFNVYDCDNNHKPEKKYRTKTFRNAVDNYTRQVYDLHEVVNKAVRIIVEGERSTRIFEFKTTPVPNNEYIVHIHDVTKKLEG